MDKKGKGASLLLINDSHNSFEHVIITLINYCGHDPLQAEQCALLAHQKGKIVIREGETGKLLDLWEALKSEGLTVAIHSSSRPVNG